uniref:3-oxoacyl-[acyl-carrier-protein] reductase n=1 Tax=Steinernema glaseri TaxID=37863 RepID=A0A1I7YG82_9BILA
MGRFDGKVVIVTGSSSGIGQATAIMYAKEGAHVTITGRNEERLEATKEKMVEHGASADHVLVVIGNVQEEECAQRLVNETIAKWNRIDILVNNAGVTVKPDVDPDSLETFDYIFSINLRGFRPQGFFGLISSSSELSSSQSSCFLISSPAKGTSFPPGFTKTSIFTRHRPHEDEGAVLQEFEDNYISQIVPMNRMATSEEIGESILFLTSEKASYITGTTLVVDGGFCVLTQDTGRF